MKTKHEDLTVALKKYFGFSTFKGRQEEIISTF
jgi:superfamily II DNA helicase RecQ